MWSLLNTRQQLLIIVGYSVAGVLSVQAVEAKLGNEPLSLLRSTSLLVLALTIIGVPVLNKFWPQIWKRWPALARLTFPDLNGEWRGEIRTTWCDPETGRRPGPIATTVRVRQSLLRTRITMQTGESRSYSTRCHLEADREIQRFRLWYSYANRPVAEVARRSMQHEGVAWLEIDLVDDPDRMRGQYYTDRRTTGDMDLSRAKWAKIGQEPNPQEKSSTLPDS